MANSTTNLDLISVSQASKETTSNALDDAASPATLFGRRATTTTALTWGFYGGTILVDGVLTQIANSTVALTANATNFVEATPAGVVSANTTGYTAGRIPLYTVVTGASTISSYTDHRAWVQPASITGRLALAMSDANTTLTAAQARNQILEFTGTLTAARDIIVPAAAQQWTVFNNTTGGFALTVKTSAGTGIAIAAGMRAIVYADATNVVRVTAIKAIGQSTFVSAATQIMNIVGGEVFRKVQVPFVFDTALSVNFAAAPVATFQGSVSGTVLTVNSSPAVVGTIQVGMTLTGTGFPNDSATADMVYITSLGTGTGGAGTYNISTTATVGANTPITGAHVGRLVYKGTETAKIWAEGAIVTECHNGNLTAHLRLHKNGLSLPGTRDRGRLVSGADIITLESAGIISLATNDYIELFAAVTTEDHIHLYSGRLQAYQLD